MQVTEDHDKKTSLLNIRVGIESQGIVDTSKLRDYVVLPSRDIMQFARSQ